MKLFVVISPEERVNTLISVLTEEAVLKQYGPYWLRMMRELHGESYEFDKDRCLSDYASVHWAGVYEDEINLLIDSEQEGRAAILANNEEVKFDE